MRRAGFVWGATSLCWNLWQVTKVASGSVECELVLGKRHVNLHGSLHGGCTSTIVDVAGTLALLSMSPLKPGVSVELSTSFTSTAAEVRRAGGGAVAV